MNLLSIGISDMKFIHLLRVLTLSIVLIFSNGNFQIALAEQTSTIFDGKFTVTEETFGADRNGGNRNGPNETTYNFIVQNNRATGVLNGTIDSHTGKAILTQKTEYGVISYKAFFILDKNTGIIVMNGSVNGEIVVSGATVIITGAVKGQGEVNKLTFGLKAPLPIAHIGKKYTPFSLCNDNKPIPKGHACGWPSLVSNPTGGVPPYTFHVIGILPRLTLNFRTGMISGTPTGINPGTYKFTICAYDLRDSRTGVCWKTSITYKK